MAKTFRNKYDAFESALRAGVLTDDDHDAQTYVGDFMYMGTDDDGSGNRVDTFKHIVTRQYVSAPVTWE